MFGGVWDDRLWALTPNEVAQWFAEIEGNPTAWVVEHDNRFLGSVRLHHISERDGTARLAIGLLDPAKLGRGYGEEAICLVLRYAFDVLGLHRVGLRVLDYNERAIRCYQKCGFVEERREPTLVGDEHHDDVLMSVLALDFSDRVQQP